MCYFLFVDESGCGKNAPYEVLAGVAIEDVCLWDCILHIHALEEHYFGKRISNGLLELKAKKLLKTKVFKHAKQMEKIKENKCRHLALNCLYRGYHKETPSREELTALAQAKISFVQEALQSYSLFAIKAFASIVDKDAPRENPGNYLRKDYAFLFERYFYFLEDKNSMGIIVFDELEKSKCHILVDQMEKYFTYTTNGRSRASRIIPEPLFVHSDLTTAIQLADLVAYIISWGVRIPNKITRPARQDLDGLAQQVLDLRYDTNRDGYKYWSFTIINSLLPRNVVE